MAVLSTIFLLGFALFSHKSDTLPRISTATDRVESQDPYYSPQPSPAEGQPSPAGSFAVYDVDRYLDESAAVTCAEYFGILDKNQPANVLAALQLLNNYNPKYFSHYVLLPQSLSLHESSWANPRAVVYGGNAEMIVTFNGNPSQLGYGDLEFMCFNKSSSTFEFRQITFPKEPNADLEDLAENEKQLPFVLSPVNGYPGTTHDCRQCHQTPSRPNWDTYNFWAGSYGAANDLLFKSDQLADITKNFPQSLLAQYTELEKSAFKKYAPVGRYAVLGVPKDKSTNLVAGKFMARLNGQRIVGELQRLGPQFDKKSFARVMYCPTAGTALREFQIDIHSSLTEEVFTAPVDSSLKSMAIESSDYQRSKDARMKAAFHIGSAPSYELVNSSSESAQIGAAIAGYYESIGFRAADATYLPNVVPQTLVRLPALQNAVKSFGIDIRNWSMIINGGYDFEDGDGGGVGSSLIQTLDIPFLTTFYPADSDLQLLVKRRRSLVGNETADELSQLDAKICDYLR